MKKSTLLKRIRDERAQVLAKRQCRLDDENAILAAYNDMWGTDIIDTKLTSDMGHTYLEHKKHILFDYNEFTGASTMYHYNKVKRRTDSKAWNFHTLPQFQAVFIPNPAAERCSKEALIYMFGFLNGSDVLNCRLVNKWWHTWAICNDTWRPKITRPYDGIPSLMEHYLFQSAMCHDLPYRLLYGSQDAARSFFLHWAEIWLNEYGAELKTTGAPAPIVYRRKFTKKTKEVRSFTVASLVKRRNNAHMNYHYAAGKAVTCVMGCFYKDRGTYKEHPSCPIIWITRHHRLEIACTTTDSGRFPSALEWINERVK